MAWQDDFRLITATEDAKAAKRRQRVVENERRLADAFLLGLRLAAKHRVVELRKALADALGWTLASADGLGRVE